MLHIHLSIVFRSLNMEQESREKDREKEKQNSAASFTSPGSPQQAADSESGMLSIHKGS